MNLRKNNFRMLKIISVEFVRIDLRATQSIHSWNSHLKKKNIYGVQRNSIHFILTFFYYSCLVQSLNIFSNATFLIHCIQESCFLSLMETKWSPGLCQAELFASTLRSAQQKKQNSSTTEKLSFILWFTNLWLIYSLVQLNLYLRLFSDGWLIRDLHEEQGSLAPNSWDCAEVEPAEKQQLPLIYKDTYRNNMCVSVWDF